MIIVVHVITALASLVLATVLFFAPSVTKFRLSYGLVAATVSSGSYLIISNQSHLLSSCFSGLAYLAAVTTAITMAHRKYVRQPFD